MQRDLLFIYILFSNFLFSQNTVITYDMKGHFGDEQYQEFLVAGEEKLYSLYIYHKLYPAYEQLLSDEVYVSSKLYTISNYQDVAQPNVLLGIRNIGNKRELMYKDFLPTIDWSISNEKRNFLGYTCTKATGKFRGRTYTAYFTSELPINAGPWKLRGLPGLILKATEDELGSDFEATKIVLNSKLLVPEKFVIYYSEPNAFRYKYEEIIKMENEYLLGIVSQMEANSPTGIARGITPPIRSASLETEFEWEDNTAKK